MAEKCGRCGERFNVGQPQLVIEPREVTGRKFLRCRTCADEPVPDDLPALAERTPIEPSPLVRAGMVKLPFDYKAAQAGREPGEED
jgi:predicted  nucleic acid-binding Zn-ribbon protein